MDKEIIEFFAEEANDLLSSLEETFLELERDDINDESTKEVKRLLHNLKGTSYSLGLNCIADLTHFIEEHISRYNVRSSDAGHFLRYVEVVREFLCLTQNDQPKEAKDKVLFFFNEFKNYSEQGGKASVVSCEDLPEAVEELIDSSHAGVEANEETEPSDEQDNKQSSTSEQTVHTQQSTFLKCKTGKVDNLINLFSELVTLQSSLGYLKKDFHANENKICSTMSQMEKVTQDLQNAVFALRMIDLRRTFQVLELTARNTAKELGFKIRVNFSGKEQELDKSIIDKLMDPLSHLLKNGIDHGLFPKFKREGEDANLKLDVSAYQKSGYFYLSIKDNGMGLCKEKIYQKAIDKGILNKNDNIDDSQIYKLIFQNGFSTSEEVTNISGRGVGMNSVYETVKSLRGDVEIHSEKGVGTEFIVKIPLSLAMFNGVVARLENKKYVIPNSDISEIINCEEVSSIETQAGNILAKVRSSAIPVVQASEVLESTFSSEREKGVLLIVTQNNQEFGIRFDQILSQQRVVSREIGEEVSHIKAISGATILNDGTLAPIINVSSFFDISKAS